MTYLLIFLISYLAIKAYKVINIAYGISYIPKVFIFHILITIL
jgi:hypothetical protein